MWLTAERLNQQLDFCFRCIYLLAGQGANGGNNRGQTTIVFQFSDGSQYTKHGLSPITQSNHGQLPGSFHGRRFLSFSFRDSVRSGYC